MSYHSEIGSLWFYLVLQNYFVDSVGGIGVGDGGVYGVGRGVDGIGGEI